MIDEAEVAARKKREELEREVEVVKAEWEAKNKGKGKKDGKKKDEKGEEVCASIYCLVLIDSILWFDVERNMWGVDADAVR